MVGGQWTNQDGLPLNFGVSKAIPELGGNYLDYGESRVAEYYLTYGQTIWGTGIVPVTSQFGIGPYSGGVSTASSNTNPAVAGIVSINNPFPAQLSTASGAGASTGFVTTSGVLTLAASQIYLEQMELEVLASFNAGTGTATAFSVGFVAWNPVAQNWGIVAPNNSVTTYPQHLMVVNATAFTAMTAGYKAVYGPSGFLYGSGASASAPTVAAGTQWVGNIPAVTGIYSAGSIVTTNLPTTLFLAAVATGTVPTTGSAYGLAKLRLKYYLYGNITQ